MISEKAKSHVEFSDIHTGPSPESPLLLNLFNGHAYHRIYNRLYDQSMVADIVTLTRICGQLSSLYKRLKPTQWQIHKGLKRFPTDPAAFRSQMAEHIAPASRKSAVQDLKEFHIVDLLGEYQSDNEGYRLISSPETLATVSYQSMLKR